jgi:Nucleotidyltransferase domain
MDDAEARDLLDEVINSEASLALGFVVTGSIARGTATRNSDLDVYVVLPDDAPPRPVARSLRLDVIPISISGIESPPVFGTPGWWQRWSFAWARVERDRTGGRLPDAVRRQATLTPSEQRAVLVDHDRLDGYLNLAYRALKSDRAGRQASCRLDAAEAVPWLLDTLFALAGRVRPYNGYLAWELANHPVPGLAASEVLGVIDGHLVGDPVAVRTGVRLVERRAGDWDAASAGTTLAKVIDAWGDDLVLLRRG